MVNPQRSGLRSDTWMCTCRVLKLERSVCVIVTRLRGISDAGILLKDGLRDNGIFMGKKYRD